MNDFTVYMHVNKINGKRYIGITHHKDLNKRWVNGKGYFRNKHFSDAIEKYGWDSFEHIVIKRNLSKEEACLLERQLIEDYETQDKTKGYNITDGGEFFHHSEDSKKLMSEHRKGKGRRKFSEEHKRKISEHHGGGADKKKVLCVETGTIYESINAAARAVNANKKLISNCCRDVAHYNTGKGYHWKFVNEV